MEELGKDSTECGKFILLEETVTSEIVLCILITLYLFSFSLLCLPRFSAIFFSPFLVASTVPSSSVLLSTSQQGSDILLTWGEIPLVNRRGYLLGYNIYNSTGSELKLLGKCYDVKCHLFKEFSCSSRGLEKGIVYKTCIIHVITSFVKYCFRKCILYSVKLIHFVIAPSPASLFFFVFSFLSMPISLCFSPLTLEQPNCQTKGAGATQ